MSKYESRMNSLRNGELVPQGGEYDPSADLAAHSASHKRVTVEHDSFLSKEQLLTLRKVQNERIEVSNHLPPHHGIAEPFEFPIIGWQDESAWIGNKELYGSADGWEPV